MSLLEAIKEAAAVLESGRLEDLPDTVRRLEIGLDQLRSQSSERTREDLSNLLNECTLTTSLSKAAEQFYGGMAATLQVRCVGYGRSGRSASPITTRQLEVSG